jgi:succinyl-diaminopimelate desuccinylase
MVSAMTEREKEIINQVTSNEVVSLLQQLIRSRSDHPPGDTRAAIGIVAQALNEEGIPFDIFAKEEEQPSLIATFPFSSAGDTLAYHAHIDTVSAGEREEWSVDPFAGKIIDGAVYGRGAGDDKGSVAAQVMALIALARAGVRLRGTLQVAAVADEESGGEVGTRWLRDTGKLKPDFLVVGEQTNNHVAIAERVACGIVLTVYGKSAHGAMPWQGDNAVTKMARVIVWLQEKLIDKLSEVKHPYLPPPTMNISTIEGGRRGFVPRRCKIHINRRLLPGETREEAMDQIRNVLDQYDRTVESLNYELFTSGDVAPNINTPPDDPFVHTADQTLTDVSGEQRKLTGYMQTSDGRWFAGDGFSIIIFGPSDPAVGHSPDECVSVEQLKEATQFLTLLALRQLGE